MVLEKCVFRTSSSQLVYRTFQAYKEERGRCLEAITAKGMEDYLTLPRVTMGSHRCKGRLSRFIKTRRTFTYLLESSQAKVKT